MSTLPSIERIAELLGGDVSNGNHVRAPGPGHSPQDRSLSIKIDSTAPDGFLVTSFAGDDAIACKDYVRQKLGLPAFEPKKSKTKSSSGWTLISEHIYRTADGEPFLKVRKCLDEDGKRQYPQSHWDGGKWVKGKPKAPKVPYRLPELLAAPLATSVYICEGEKDADNLAKIGFVATCNSEGAAGTDRGASKKWPPELNQHFKDRPCYILPDNDVPGHRHAQHVARNLAPIAASIYVVDLPGLSNGGDVSDWLESDPTGARLVRECKAAPLWEATARSTSAKRPGTSAEFLGKKQADALIELAEEAELFCTPSGDAYADVIVGSHRETYRVRAKTFRSWLAHRFYQTRAGAPNSEAIGAAIGIIEARALFDGPQLAVHVRVAGYQGKVYIDLADAAWRAIEVDADGWRMISTPPVRFRRASGMLPLPEPIKGGSIKTLRPLLNVRRDDGKKATYTDADFVLAVAWLLSAIKDRGPYPVLALNGEQGSAKSTLSAILRALIDPNVAPLRALPREDRDLFVSASNAYTLVFDNVSGLPTWISDTLCRLSTGGGFSTRQLYTDDGEVMFDAMRPIILNGIEDVAMRPDLVDRAVMLSLETVREQNRRPEADLWAAFYQDRPAILGALLDAVAHGLSNLHKVQLKRLPRMADFYKWVVACESALWPQGTFATAYDANQKDAIGGTIEADLVATAVCALMTNKQSWTGTASELLAGLGLLISETQRRSKDWPTQPHVLSGRLRRVAPALRKVETHVTFVREGAKRRSISIERRSDSGGKTASPASPVSFGKDVSDLEVTLEETGASQPASQASSPWSSEQPPGDDAHDACLACFYDYRQHLAPGERGTVLVISADRKQSRVIMRYVRGFLTNIPMLKRMIEREGAEHFDLTNRISIEVATASFKTVRGYSVVAGLLDELAFWSVDSDAANPDSDIIAAIRPGMATIPSAMLLCASSPYARRGALWDAHRKHHGRDNDPVLTWQAPTATMNPSVPARVIADAYEADPASAAAEYGANFRVDVEALLSRETVEACIASGRHELEPTSGTRFVGFVDPSGGSADSMTLAVAHRDAATRRVVLDAIRERRPPFSPDQVAKDFADLLRTYRITRVTGDRYAGEWPRERFRVHGIQYELSDKPKSDLYGAMLPLLNAGRAELLDLPRLAAQLIGLERKTARSGRDSIDHAPGGHDDICNAAAGALLLADAHKPLIISADLLAAAARPTRYSRSHPPRSHLMGTRLFL